MKKQTSYKIKFFFKNLSKYFTYYYKYEKLLSFLKFILKKDIKSNNFMVINVIYSDRKIT